MAASHGSTRQRRGAQVHTAKARGSVPPSGLEWYSARSRGIETPARFVVLRINAPSVPPPRHRGYPLGAGVCCAQTSLCPECAGGRRDDGRGIAATCRPARAECTTCRPAARQSTFPGESGRRDSVDVEACGPAARDRTPVAVKTDPSYPISIATPHSPFPHEQYNTSPPAAQVFFAVPTTRADAKSIDATCHFDKRSLRGPWQSPEGLPAGPPARARWKSPMWPSEISHTPRTTGGHKCGSK